MQVTPSWIFFSEVFFIVGTLALLALGFICVRLLLTVGELEKKIQRLSYKVESLTEKLESAAATAKDTVESVGGSARSIAGTMEGTIVGSFKKLESVSTALFLALAVLKLWREVGGARRPAKVDKEAPNSG